MGLRSKATKTIQKWLFNQVSKSLQAAYEVSKRHGEMPPYNEWLEETKEQVNRLERSE